jgi:curli production assembly/transport component CsgG/holdfast attachment protein HfaB
LAFALAGCGSGIYPSNGVTPNFSFPVTTNETPYSQCLTGLAKIPGNNLPTFAVGELADKTGQLSTQSGSGYSTVLSQGVSEMMMSALFKTNKVRMVERFDLRVPLAEMRMTEQGLVTRQGGTTQRGTIRGSDFVIVGALTELNYNIVSEGARLAIGGIGGGARTVVINVALDMRVINSRSFDVSYIAALQKQIYGYEVEANVFRFFGNQLVEFDAGRIQNEPLQLGVRSVVEMGVYQIMTEFLGLPGTQDCALVQVNPYENYLTKKET